MRSSSAQGTMISNTNNSRVKEGSWLRWINKMVVKTPIDRYFQISQRKTSLTREMRAGTVTFLTMAYILVVNAGILRDTGGPCSVHDCEFNNGQNNCMFGEPGQGFDPGYLRCVESAKRSFISATAISSFITCFLMGAVANLPLALAPGMGINAFFTYTAVGYFGVGGLITYKQAIAACFIEGWIFLLLSVTGVRGHVIRLVPKAVMSATAGGIGLFLTFIGLQASEGMGIVTFDPATLVTLGACPPEERAAVYTLSQSQISNVCSCQLWNGTAVPTPGSPNLGPTSAVFYCMGKRMRSATAWLGIAGGTLMVVLIGRDFRGAVIAGILFVTFVSWIPNHGATYLGASSPVPGGEARLDFFRQVVSLPSVEKTVVAWDWSAFGTADLWAAMLSFLYLDFLDCTGTLFSMAIYLNRLLPGFINSTTKEFPRQTLAFCVDGIGIIIGSLLGIAPLTVYIESATGIREGGRTGLTALTVSAWFFVALFFTPVIASIPPYASGPALVLVGALMMENFLDVNWSHIHEAVPAFMVIVLIPFTYSVAYGVIAGLVSSMFLWLAFFLYDIAAALLGRPGETVKQVLERNIPWLMERKAMKKTTPTDRWAGLK